MLECFDDDNNNKHTEFEQKEALLFLDITRAWNNVWKLEQKLTQAKWDEINITGKLYKLQTEEAERRSGVAKARVSVIRNLIHMMGERLCDTLIQKCHYISSEDSIQIEAGMSQEWKLMQVNSFCFRSTFGLTRSIAHISCLLLFMLLPFLSWYDV